MVNTTAKQRPMNQVRLCTTDKVVHTRLRALGMDLIPVSWQSARRYLNLSQFNSNCPTFTPKVTSGKKLSQCRECVSKQKRFQFMLENVRIYYFLNWMGQAVPSFRPGMGETAFAKLQPSCQWFITVSPDRSETDSRRDICGSSNLVTNPLVGCSYFPPGPRLFSQPKRSPPWLQPNYTAWWLRHTGVSSLPKATTQWCPARTRTSEWQVCCTGSSIITSPRYSS